MSAEILAAVLETAAAASAAILLALLLGRALRTRLGAHAAYASWLCVPAALVAVLLPARSAPVQWIWAMPQASPTLVQPMAALPAPIAPPWAWLLATWAAGALIMAAVLWRQQRRFLRGLGALRPRADGLLAAQATRGLPAAIGLLRPRVVVPADFDRRYDAQERALILGHERTHIARGDLWANLLVALLRCVHWFNPLVHYAAHRYRCDQELACDESIIARHPGQRRRYGEAMLKTQLEGTPLPVGCHWPAHPLKERIAMLGRPSPSRAQRRLAWLMATALIAVTSYAAWRTQPARAAVAAQDFHYRVAMKAGVDGDVGEYELHEYPGRTFGVASSGEGKPRWSVEIRIDPIDAERIRIAGEIVADGMTVSRPTLVAALGGPVGIQVTLPDGATFALSMDVARQAGPIAAGRAAGTARGPASADPVAAAADRARMPPPSYPRAALREGLSGRVVLLVDVDADGVPSAARVERSEPAGAFDESALAAVKRWRFQPAMKDGRPVAGRVRVPIDFSSEMKPVAAPDGVADARRYRWFQVGTDSGVQETICDIVRSDDKDPDVFQCGVLIAAETR